jgi:ribosomal protein S12 methylthiotransferase accessory factor
MSTQVKTFFTGTHRLVSPEQTWERVQAALPLVGVTRVADVTDLDACGIPVVLAMRPDARSLVVAAGKGVSRLLAKVGAAMESVEVWQAEYLRPPDVVAPAKHLDLPYPLDSLQLAAGSMVTRDTPLEWLLGRGVLTGAAAPVPRQLIHLTSVVTGRWNPPLFLGTTNGLASGNSVAEATQHALLEVIERQCLYEFYEGMTAATPVDRDSLAEPGLAELLDKLDRAGNLVRILDITNTAGVPCFHAEIRNETVPFTFAGAGCHPAPEVAVSRAVTEAVQSRLGVIVGSRDDLDDVFYTRASDPARGRGSRLPFSPTDAAARPLRDGSAAATFDEDVRLLATRVLELTGYEPVVVDLTSAECGIPVVKVVAPGLDFDPRKSFRPEPAAGDGGAR